MSQEKSDLVECGEALIPDNILIPCPKTGTFANVLAKRCLKCDDCKSVVCFNENDKVPWSQRHQVVCAYPIHRSVTEFEA